MSYWTMKNIGFRTALQWRRNDHDGVPNHQPHGCLLNRLFRRRSKKTPKLRVTGLLWGIHRGPVNSPHKWPVTRKMFPFDDVIMISVAINHWNIKCWDIRSWFVKYPVIRSLHSIDDAIKWKKIPRYWPFVWGIHQSPVDSPHKGQRRGALIFSLNKEVKQTVETPVIWDAIMLIMTSL